MRHDENDQEASGTPPVRRCRYCGAPLLVQRRGAKYCSRQHKELHRARRQRAGARLTRLRAAHPFPGSADLPGEPGVIGLDDEQDDDAGIVAGDSDVDSWRQRDDAWAAQQEFAAAVKRLRATYERRMRPHLEQQRRNPGPMRPELAALTRERDAKIRELERGHYLPDAFRQAERDRPGRIADARERAVEQAAARAFAADLGRSRHLRDAWLW